MLGIIVATLFIALLTNILLKKFDLPTIIGYIFTGTIISYLFNLHHAVHNHELNKVAEFGIVFLMFTVGLEFSVKHLKEMKYEVFVLGGLQILITSLSIYLIAFHLFHLHNDSALIISMAVAMSSTAIVLKTFNETGEINKQYGKNAFGILIMQDIAVVPILIVIGIISTHHTDISFIVIKIFFAVLILLLAIYIIGTFLLEPFFSQIVKTKSDELFISSVLFLAIGASYGAHLLNFSYSLGAFVAGMLIAETKYKHQAEADLIPFRDILLGIFFITVGMQIKFHIILNYAHIIFLLLVSIMFIKFIIIYAIVKIKKSNNKRTRLKTSFSLIQIGEFALAILGLANTNSLIQAPYGQIMTITIVLSMIMTPFILKNLSRISDYFIPNAEDTLENMHLQENILKHTLILGYGEFGQSVSSKLRNDGEPYMIIENNINQYEIAQANNEIVIFGNAANKEILKKASIDKAKKVIIAIDNPKKLYLICHYLQKMIDSDKIIVKVHSFAEKKSLLEIGLKHIIVENEVTTKEILHYI